MAQEGGGVDEKDEVEDGENSFDIYDDLCSVEKYENVQKNSNEKAAESIKEKSVGKRKISANPAASASDESNMCVDLDFYTDFLATEESNKTQKLKNVEAKLIESEKMIKAMESKVKYLDIEKFELKKQNEILIKNMSKLTDTAKEEISKKGIEIQKLKLQIKMFSGEPRTVSDRSLSFSKQREMSPLCRSPSISKHSLSNTEYIKESSSERASTPGSCYRRSSRDSRSPDNKACSYSATSRRYIDSDRKKHYDMKTGAVAGSRNSSDRKIEKSNEERSSNRPKSQERFSETSSVRSPSRRKKKVDEEKNKSAKTPPDRKKHAESERDNHTAYDRADIDFEKDISIEKSIEHISGSHEFQSKANRNTSRDLEKYEYNNEFKRNERYHKHSSEPCDKRSGRDLKRKQDSSNLRERKYEETSERRDNHQKARTEKSHTKSVDGKTATQDLREKKSSRTKLDKEVHHGPSVVKCNDTQRKSEKHSNSRSRTLGKICEENTKSQDNAYDDGLEMLQKENVNIVHHKGGKRRKLVKSNELRVHNKSKDYESDNGSTFDESFPKKCQKSESGVKTMEKKKEGLIKFREKTAKTLKCLLL